MPTSKGPKQQPNPDHDEHAAEPSVSTQVANKGEDASTTAPAAPAEDQADAQTRAVSGANGAATNGNGHAQNGLPPTANDAAASDPAANENGPATDPSGAGQPDSPAVSNDNAVADSAAADGGATDGAATGRVATDGVGTENADNGEAGEAAPDAGIGAEETALPRNAVKIKGRPGGVSLEIGEGDWEQLLALLADRLAAAEGFFRGGRVVLEAGGRSLDAAQLRQVRNLLEERGMKLGIVRSTADHTLQAAHDVGISTKNDDAEPAPEPAQPASRAAPPVHPPVAEAPLPAPPADFVYRGSLRSGQVLRKAESIVVIGDVNPGAQVISSGDIMVWGRLRGIARAGVDGNKQAVVAALDFIPTQLRIASVTAVPPEKKRSPAIFFWRRSPKRRPEIARIIDGRIVVEPWDEAKRNRLGSSRR